MGRIGVFAALCIAGFAFAVGSQSARTPQYAAPVVVGQVPAGGYVSQLAVADFNGDGLQDAIVTRSLYQSQETFPVTVLVNDGHGHFTDQTASIFVGAPPKTQNARELVVADFNRDGRPDVFAADHGDDRDPFAGYQNTLILSAPGGKLIDATANLPQVFDFTHDAAAGDVNGDGATDIFVGNEWGRDRVPPRILLNDGSGHFRVFDGSLSDSVTDLDAHRYMSSLFADVNGDGKLDLVLGTDSNGGASTVLLNNGTGAFSNAGGMPPKPFGGNAATEDIAPLDLNGDGRIDLVAVSTKSGSGFNGRWIQVLVNNGDGTFRDETATRLPQAANDDVWPTFVETRDLDGSGTPDLAVHIGGGGGGSPLIYLSDAAGAFHLTPSADVPGQLWAFVDADGDGGTDILSVAPGSGVVSLSHEGPPPAATTTTTAPATTAIASTTTAALPQVPAAPTGVTATRNLKTGVRISWQSVPDATAYEVWRGRTEIAETVSTSYVDRKAARGRAYGYRVRAGSTAGTGPFSPIVTGRRAP